MRMLVMGGERFFGHYIIATALARRHHVSTFHRHAPATALEPRGEHIPGDRNKDLSLLFDGGWEAAVDITRYTATDVERLTAPVSGQCGQYVLISSTAFYAYPQTPGYLENKPLVDLKTRVAGNRYL